MILTSGTLSPLDTFASELGTDFKQTLEAPHVADVKKQVWAGVLPSGPDRVKLKADYATSSSLSFQDSVGSSVLKLCEIIPDGILLFVPSYHLMVSKMSKVSCLRLFLRFTLSLCRTSLLRDGRAPRYGRS